MSKKNYICQCGRTFIETMGYIMVMTAVTVVIASTVSNMYYKYEISEINEELSELKKAISSRYAADGHYANININDLCADRLGPRGVMPHRTCTEDGGVERCGCASTSMHHTFDGEVTLGSDASSDNLMFYITFAGLPKDVCAQLAVKDWNFSGRGDLDRMIINDNKTWRWQPSAEELPFPVDVATVAEACSQDGYGNKITWFFN